MFFANFIFLFTAVQDNFILLTPIAKEKYKDHESDFVFGYYTDTSASSGGERAQTVSGCSRFC